MKTYLVSIALAATMSISSCQLLSSLTASESAQIAALEVEVEDAVAVGDMEAAQAAADKLATLEADIGERAMGVAVDFIDPFVPVPLQPFKEWIIGLGGMMMFKRPRKRLRDAAKSLMRLDLKGVMGQTLAAVGLKHSSSDPIAIMKGAAAQARKAGDVKGAIAIQEAIGLMQAAATKAA